MPNRVLPFCLLNRSCLPCYFVFQFQKNKVKANKIKNPHKYL